MDGAIGAVAVLAENVNPRLLRALNELTRLALDLHKWMHIPFEAACVIVRSETRPIADTFTLTPDYLAHELRGLAAGHLWFSDYGLQFRGNFAPSKSGCRSRNMDLTALVA